MCAGPRPPNKPRLIAFAVLGAVLLSAAIALAVYIARTWEFRSFGSAFQLLFFVVLLAGAAAASWLGPCVFVVDTARKARRVRGRK